MVNIMIKIIMIKEFTSILGVTMYDLKKTFKINSLLPCKILNEKNYQHILNLFCDSQDLKSTFDDVILL